MQKHGDMSGIHGDVADGYAIDMRSIHGE
jgi:hypothetical protein